MPNLYRVEKNNFPEEKTQENRGEKKSPPPKKKKYNKFIKWSWTFFKKF